MAVALVFAMVADVHSRLGSKWNCGISICLDRCDCLWQSTAGVRAGCRRDMGVACGRRRTCGAYDDSHATGFLGELACEEEDVKLGRTLLVLVSLTSILVVIPRISTVHAANWSVNPTYSATCMLGHYAQDSGSASGGGDSYHTAGASCNGAGYLQADADSIFAGQSSANANLTFVDSQSFSVPNDGQSYTQLSISATYFVIGFLWSNGYASLGLYDARSQLQVSLSLVVNGVPLANSTTVDRGWGTECSVSGITLDPSLQVKTCLEGAASLPLYSRFTAMTGYRLYPGNTYALRLSFIASSNSWSGGLSMGDSHTCFVYQSPATDAGQCAATTIYTAPPQSPTTQCPSGAFSNPCYYVQWQYATYSFSDMFPGPAGFGILPQTIVTGSPTLWNTGSQNMASPDGQYVKLPGAFPMQVATGGWGYSVNLPTGSTITKVEVVSLHYEVASVSGSYQVICANLMPSGSQNCNSVPYRASPALDSFDVTFLKSTWNSGDVSNIKAIWKVGGVDSYLDWLALRITYTLPPVYQNGPSWSQPLNITAVNGFSSTVSLTAIVSTNGPQNPPALSISQSSLAVSSSPPAPGLPASYVLSLSISATSSTTPGSYTVTVTATGGGITQLAYVTVLVALVDPAVTLSLSQHTVHQGVNNVIILNAAEANTGNVQVPAETVYFLSNNVQIASWVPSTSTLSPGQLVSGSANWNVQSLPVGIYNITAYVQPLQYEYLATNRMMTRLDVDPAGVDFGVSTSTGTVYVPRGGSGNVPITLSASNGFSGGITATGSTSSGLSWDFPPVFRPDNGHATFYVNGTATSATIAINATQTATLGSQTITVTVSSDLPLSHSITLTVVVQPPEFNFSISAKPTSVSIAQGNFGLSNISLVSLRGWSGWVTLNYFSTVNGIYMAVMPMNLTIASGATVNDSPTIGVPCNVPTGTYPNALTVNGTNGYLEFHSVSISVTVTSYTCNSGGGGGSVAYGTLVTLADGSRVPVQSLRVGDQLLGYNTATGQLAGSVVSSIKTVITGNQLIIITDTGQPFRVDANPAQTLWVKTASGSIGWLSVTQIKVGDSLFTVNGWVPVTVIQFAPAGQHIMFDITATVPYFASGYLDPVHKM